MMYQVRWQYRGIHAEVQTESFSSKEEALRAVRDLDGNARIMGAKAIVKPTIVQTGGLQ